MKLNQQQGNVLCCQTKHIQIFLVLALLLAAGVANANDYNEKVSFTPRPDWVEVAELPQPSTERKLLAQNGEYFLLLDTQIKITAGKSHRYRRLAQQVLDRSGLESAGKLSFEYDPHSQSLSVHAIRVWRDGEAQDRLSKDMFEVVRQEPELYDDIILGDLTAFTLLTDIRVGDIVDYEISWIEESLIWPNGYSANLTMEWSVPIEEQNIRILSPKYQPIYYKLHGSDQEPSITGTAEAVEYKWKLNGNEIVGNEEHIPNGHSAWGYVSISTMKDWREVAAWASDIFDVDRSLPKGAVEQALGDKGHSLSDIQKITRATRYVQEKIRYLGDEVGLGSHVPRTAKRVLELGYGDCKDKSILLVAILREIGVDAFPALAHTRRGGNLPNRLPSPYAFNHAIVGVNHGDRTFWIDPTLSHQGGIFPRMAALSYAYALPIRPGQSQLEVIENPSPKLPEQDTIETFDFAGLKEDGLSLNVVTIRRGAEANNFRYELARSRKSDYTENYLSYYTKLYPGIQSAGPVNFSDNLDRNIIRTVEDYLIPTEVYNNAAWPMNFYLRAESLEDIAPKIAGDQRQNPIALPHPIFRRYNHRLENIYEGFDNIDKEVASDFLNFKRQGVHHFNGFEVKTMIWGKSPVVPTERASEYQSIAREISQNIGVTYDLSAPEITSKKIVASNSSEDNLTTTEIVYGLYLVSLLAVIYPIMAYTSIKAHRPYRNQSELYPVNVNKFVILSLSTAGFYTFIWMWKNWLWIKTQQQKSVWPFIYTMLSIITIFPLVRKIRAISANSSRPLRYGAVIAFSYCIMVLLSYTLEYTPFIIQKSAGLILYSNNWLLWYKILMIFLCITLSLVLIPLVRSINAANIDNQEAYDAHSKWSARAIVGGVLGAPIWLVWMLD